MGRNTDEFDEADRQRLTKQHRRSAGRSTAVMKLTTVSAYPGFAVSTPIFDRNGICGLDLMPVVAWQIEGSHANTGQLIPVTKRDAVEPDDVYAIQRPDDSFRFPDGERCDSEDAVLASFRKRCGARQRRRA